MNIHSLFEQRFSLLADKATDQDIETRIRENIELTGATPWILMFAILIASIGLNVNSTAVVIGAMLISPLMGPIMGLGLGTGIYDFNIVKRSLLNLALSTVIALVVSTLYFILTPLHGVQSELVARTNPTVWDVLIAICGGFAGIIGISRKEKSNVVPGVAIATALMPPICTAGFGLATAQWQYFFGALYLYIINCVFIAVSTIIGIQLLGIRAHLHQDPAIGKRIKKIIWIASVCTLLPSIYLAVKLVEEEIFIARANNFVAQEFKFESTYVSNTKIDGKNRQIDVTLVGEPLDEKTKNKIQLQLSLESINDAKLDIHEISNGKIDIRSLKAELFSDIYQDSQASILKKDNQIKELESELDKRNALFHLSTDIIDEIASLYPGIQSITVGNSMSVTKNHETRSFPSIRILADQTLSPPDRQRVSNWLKTRLHADDLEIQFQ